MGVGWRVCLGSSRGGLGLPAGRLVQGLHEGRVGHLVGKRTEVHAPVIS